MNDYQIKVMFSKEILKFNDVSAEMCLRRILFASNRNTIDWQESYKIALDCMPELKNYKPD